MGQYSTGKSTFVRHLLQRDYPGLRIGPEPTTDTVGGGNLFTSRLLAQILAKNVRNNAFVSHKFRPNLGA